MGIKEYIKSEDNVVLLTGASGLLGKSLLKSISKNSNVISLGRNNFDYYYELSMNIQNIIPKDLKIKLFIHSAYDHSNSTIEGLNINIFAMNNISKFCSDNGIPLIYISSMAALSSASQYGANKRGCELVCEDNPDCKILRLGMLHNERVGLINKIKKIISKLPFIPMPGKGNFIVYLADVDRVVEFIAGGIHSSKKYYYLIDGEEYFYKLINPENKLTLSIPIPLIKYSLILFSLFGFRIKSISYDGLIGLINPPVLPKNQKLYDENT